ncbi:MAG TPA: hypothetical protein VIH95_07365 [Acidimicrobiales bacterium]
MLFATQLGSNPLGVIIVAGVIYALSRPIIRWVVEKEQNPWLLRILMWSLILHLLAAPAQVFVVDHLYHGIADWTRYDSQGSILAPNFRSFNFTLAGSNVRGIVNDGSLSIVAGVVMAVVGVNQLAAFLVFSWMSWLGTILFYRAFTVTFPGKFQGHKRYAYLVFFLPSTIFWTADVSKEAVMMVSLGLVAYGCAKVLVRAPGGFRLVTVGAAAGYFIRPNELVVVLAGFAVALMVRPAGDGVKFATIKRIGGLVFMVFLLASSIYVTLHYLRLSSGGSTSSLTTANASNAVYGGSGGVAYSSSPLRWPIDFYTVLFDPLPFNAHGSGEYAAAVENLVILGVFVASYRQLRILPRTMFARPYVMMCVVYSILFVYAFAALGNLGLIYRERVMLLPFLMVPLAIPRTPKGRPKMLEWEYRRRDRPKFRAAMLQHDRTVRSMRMALADPKRRRPLPVADVAPTADSDRSADGRPAVDVLDGGQHPTPPPSSGSP